MSGLGANCLQLVNSPLQICWRLTFLLVYLGVGVLPLPLSARSFLFCPLALFVQKIRAHIVVMNLCFDGGCMQFFEPYRSFLVSDNYVTKRQSLKVCFVGVRCTEISTM